MNVRTAPWLFGRNVDLLVFGGSAAAAFALLGVGAVLGILDGDTPDSVWLACVVAVDVAHVWSTAFRVYLDGEELRRRAPLYIGVPVACYCAGVMVHAFSSAAFWRVLAYVAVFHFVRQQYGWVMLYRKRNGERGRLDLWLDTATIYASTVYPLLWWHGHLPRRFHWFIEGDFVQGVAGTLATALEPLYWSLLAVFALRQAWLFWFERRINAGKILVVVTTWACWWVGIMVLDSDFAFTVTNVLIHGVPYMALTYRYGSARAAQRPMSTLSSILKHGAAAFVVFVVAAALIEEAMWDRFVWHERAWIFGNTGNVSGLVLTFLVPLLALPQAIHYVLDGFVWRTRDKNPALASALRLA